MVDADDSTSDQITRRAFLRLAGGGLSTATIALIIVPTAATADQGDDPAAAGKLPEDRRDHGGVTRPRPSPTPFPTATPRPTSTPRATFFETTTTTVPLR